jgi:hypothetical protein
MRCPQSCLSFWLWRASLSTAGCSAIGFHPPTEVSLPNLRSIRLYSQSYQNVRFLVEISAPGLVDFLVEPFLHRRWTTFETMQQDVGLSFPALKTLALSTSDENITIPHDEMHDTFHSASNSLPGIERLTFLGKKSHPMIRGLAEAKDAKA